MLIIHISSSSAGDMCYTEEDFIHIKYTMCDNGIISIHSKNETIIYLWLLHKSDNQKI